MRDDGDGGATGIDRRQLLDAAGGDADLAAELVALLASDARRLLAEIDLACDAGDAAALGAAAHSLKGSALTLGFIHIARSARALEETVSRGDDPRGLVEDIRGRVGAIDPRLALG